MNLDNKLHTDATLPAPAVKISKARPPTPITTVLGDPVANPHPISTTGPAKGTNPNPKPINPALFMDTNMDNVTINIISLLLNFMIFKR